MTQLKILVTSRTGRTNQVVGVANFDLGDFLNSHLTIFNTTERLTKCEDRRASIGYQLIFEVKDGFEERTVPLREQSSLPSYDRFTKEKPTRGTSLSRLSTLLLS